MSAIKLFKIEPLDDGTIRLQSQLCVGSDSADFIIRDGVLKCYGRGPFGFDFYDYDGDYEIVENISDMQYQKL